MKAKDLDEFKLEVFDGNLELKEIMRAFNFLDTSPKWGEFFLEKVKNIFEIFKDFSQPQLEQLKYWYEVNNDIEQICQGLESPIMYKELKYFDEKLTREFQGLYGTLYNKKIIGLKNFSNNIGLIDTHYKEFMKVNDEGVCPFCGIHQMKGINHTKREAYDHFFPKGQYPFNSINFKNLAPMCHECNSSYKLEHNSIFTKSKIKRKAFYPYRQDKTEIKISLDLRRITTKEEIVPNNIDLIISSPNEEVETWKSLFGIDERYKAVFCEKANGRYWLLQILEEATIRSESCENCFKVKKELFKLNPYNEMNFLKVPFLEACEEIGLLNHS